MDYKTRYKTASVILRTRGAIIDFHKTYGTGKVTKGGWLEITKQGSGNNAIGTIFDAKGEVLRRNHIWNLSYFAERIVKGEMTVREAHPNEDFFVL